MTTLIRRITRLRDKIRKRAKSLKANKEQSRYTLAMATARGVSMALSIARKIEQDRINKYVKRHASARQKVKLAKAILDKI